MSENEVLERKRKRVESETVENPPSLEYQLRKLQRNGLEKSLTQQGNLSAIFDLPQELWFEIFGCLNPIDLIHLSRTSKGLRSFFMSRTTQSIWKSVISNIPQLPACPSDMNEPRYASLVFVKKCNFCPRDQGIIHIVWASRIRACTKCIEKRWRTRKIAPLPGMDNIYPFIPWVDFTSKGLDWRYYDFDTECKWREEYKKAEDGFKWVADKVDEQSTIKKHAKAGMDWEQMQPLRYVEPGGTLEQRISIILDRLRADGWQSELTLMSEEGNMKKLIDDDKVVKACQKELTAEVFLELDPWLDQKMTEAFERKLGIERRALLSERIPIIHKILQAYIESLPANSVCPGIGDVICHPLVQDYINGPDPESVECLRTMMPQITSDTRAVLDNKLRDLIRLSTPPGHNHEALNLATTIFSCTGPCGTLEVGYESDTIRYPRVLIHYCTVYANDSAPGSKEIDVDICGQLTRKTSWNQFNVIKLDKDNHQVLSQIVAMAGLDPKTATVAEMDAADPIFECLPCNSDYEGRATMRWSCVPGHRKSFSCNGRRNEMNFKLLEGKKAEMVRSRMNEEEERRQTAVGFNGMICAHCKARSGTAILRDHCKKTHGIRNPTNEDIFPVLDASWNQRLFRLWPPREDELEVNQEVKDH